jgi:diaphanous 1
MKRFANSVQHITGQELEVKAASDGNSMTVVEQEMEGLRTQVDKLSEEVSDDVDMLNLQLTFCLGLAHRAAK